MADLNTIEGRIPSISGFSPTECPMPGYMARACESMTAGEMWTVEMPVELDPEMLQASTWDKDRDENGEMMWKTVIEGAIYYMERQERSLHPFVLKSDGAGDNVVEIESHWIIRREPRMVSGGGDGVLDKKKKKRKKRTEEEKN